MFTPPPSPLPPLNGERPSLTTPEPLLESPEKSQSRPPSPPVSRLKRRIGRRMKWTAFLVPMALILITLSTRYLTHPAAFDVLSDFSPGDWTTLKSRASDWRPHKRHPANLDTLATTNSTYSETAGASPTTSQTLAGTAQPLPTIPDNPTLPTPFPQPFDSDISQNFSSTSCFNFFTNMTNTAAFRSCRPFSLLLQSSAALVNAQDNLTTLNSIVWGTCHTTLSNDQCTQNMDWFATTLKTACAQDLKDQNANAVDTLTALEAFPLLYQAGCLSDPTTNTYCYLSAVHNSNPSDLYIYQLPLGISFPQSATPTCSACTKSLMALYVNALETSSTGLDALQATYSDAEELSVKTCGTGYAATAAAATSGARRARAMGGSELGEVGVVAVMMGMAVWTLLGGWLA